jgi:hypothetical protein
MSDRPNPASRLPRHVPRTPGDYGPGHLKVDNMLRPEHRDLYYAFLRKPGTTLRQALQLLRDLGYRVGPVAVGRHLRKFRDQLKAIRQSAEMSLACADLVRQVGPHRMSDAAVLRFETLLTEALFEQDRGGKLGKPQWDMLGRALTTAVTNRSKVETIRLSDEAAKREAGRDGNARRKRIDGVAIADKVRRILGVPLPGEPLPALPPPVEPPPPPAPEGRQTLAHDASRGDTNTEANSPGGA